MNSSSGGHSHGFGDPILRVCPLKLSHPALETLQRGLKVRGVH